MTRRRVRLFSAISALLVAFGPACRGSEESLGPAELGDPTASALVMPAAATIQRGGTTIVTAVFRVTGGLRIDKIVVSRPYAGITIYDKSTRTEGSTITRVFTIGADNTIPEGAHQVSFKPSVATTGPAPQITSAVFTLTVAQ